MQVTEPRRRPVCRPGPSQIKMCGFCRPFHAMTERRLHFDSPTRTRVNSDSCVNDGYCLRHFSVDTSPSTYFSPFPSRTLPRSARTMTDSGELRSSISLPGYHVDFFTFAEHVSFEHSTGSSCPVIYSGREGNCDIYRAGTRTHFKLQTSSEMILYSQEERHDRHEVRMRRTREKDQEQERKNMATVTMVLSQLRWLRTCTYKDKTQTPHLLLP